MDPLEEYKRKNLAINMQNIQTKPPRGGALQQAVSDSRDAPRYEVNGADCDQINIKIGDDGSFFPSKTKLESTGRVTSARPPIQPSGAKKSGTQSKTYRGYDSIERKSQSAKSRGAP